MGLAAPGPGELVVRIQMRDYLIAKAVSPPPLIFFLGAIVLFTVAIGSAIYSLHFLNNSELTTGKVIEIISETDSEGKERRYPVYSFEDSMGDTYRQRAYMLDGKTYTVGENIPIRYLIKKPDKSRIDNRTTHWFVTIISIIGSVALTLVGVFFRYKKRLMRNKE